MVRAGISLPALQHLMGHADIHTTMLYVQIAPQDVWREYARAVQQRARLVDFRENVMRRSQRSLGELFEAQIQVLAITLRPRSVVQYRCCTRGFLGYLHANFPHLHKLSQLRRDPHLLGWFRFLCQHDPRYAIEPASCISSNSAVCCVT